MATSQYSDYQLFKRLMRQARPCWLHITAFFSLGLLATPIGLLAPLPLKIAVDSAIGSRPLPHALVAILPSSLQRSNTSALSIAIGLLVAIALLDQAQVLSSGILYAYTGEKLLLDFRSKIFGHLQRLSLTYHDTQGTADALYRIQNDAASIQYISIDGVIPFITSGFTLVAMLYITFRIDWMLALVALAISPLLYILSNTFRPCLRKRSREVKKLESTTQSVVQEVLSALRVVKAFGKEEYERDRYVKSSYEGMRARVLLAWLSGRYDLFVGLTTAIGTAAVLWIGVRHVQLGTLSLGNLILMMAYIGQLYTPLKTIGRKASSLQGHFAGAERAFSTLDLLPDVPSRPDARPLVRARGVVEFQDVSFAYGGDHPVLQDINFEVPSGSRVGIAGHTGAGKTTLVSLLIRFFDPSAGRILLDGVDLRDYELADLRNQFAIVLQEPVLFSNSIADNIAYASPGASKDEIIQAAKLANAHDFITSLPESYDTRVGERGMRLSGGERQRISLARAFLKDAPILLLDEPTSSVDTKTEATIMDAMERLMWGRTTFIIAHRLNTLETCDIRVELKNGKLLFFGPGDSVRSGKSIGVESDTNSETENVRRSRPSV